MILYILIILYFMILLLCDEILGKNNYKGLLLFLSLIPLFILAGFRHEEIGNDTTVYLSLFENIATVDDVSMYFTARYEVGYVIYNYIVGLISSEPLFFLVTTSGILISSYAYFILRYSKRVIISVLLFFLCGFWSQSMNTIRMQFTIIILLFSYDYIIQKKFYKFIIFVAVAFLFHKTAIIFAIAYPLYHIKLKLMHYAGIGIMTTLICVYLNPILVFIIKKINFYSDYTDSVYRDGDVRFAIIISIAITVAFLLLFLIIRKIKTKSQSDSENIFAINEIDTGIKFITATLAINIISTQFNLLNRCGDYFFIFMICFVPNIIETLRDEKLKRIINLTIIFCFIIYFFIIQIYRPDWNRIYPFKFYWN